MKSYLVDITYTVIDTYDVEAENEYEAKSLARELFTKMEFPSDHTELEDYTYTVKEL